MSGAARWGAGRARRQASADDGFSLVEVLVAMTLLALVLLGAERAITDTMEASLLAKEHSIATGLVTEAMAEAVAMPFQDLEQGLNPNVDCPALGGSNCVANDPYLVFNGSNYQLKLDGSVVPDSTSIVPTANTNTSEAPIVPEVTTITQGVTYTVHAYPTIDSSAPKLVTVVVVVTWHSPSGEARVVGEDSIGQP